MKKGVMTALLAGTLAQFAAFPACAGDFLFPQASAEVKQTTAEGQITELRADTEALLTEAQAQADAIPAEFEAGHAAEPEGAEQIFEGLPSARSSSAFSFGDAASPNTFENQWAGYAYVVPGNCDMEAGWDVYQDIFYEQKDAVYDLGIATDMAVTSRDTSEEKPDPELDNADCYVVMTFFLSTKENAPGQNLDAFAKKALRTATGSERLPEYADVGKASFGGYEWLHYKADYGEIMQRIYHETFGADGKEHPAYEEQYHYRMDLYFRRIDDKIMGISTLASGKYYGQSDKMLTGFLKR